MLGGIWTDSVTAYFEEQEHSTTKKTEFERFPEPNRESDKTQNCNKELECSVSFEVVRATSHCRIEDANPSEGKVLTLALNVDGRSDSRSSRFAARERDVGPNRTGGRVYSRNGIISKVRKCLSN